MATFNWSDLTDEQSLVFDPNVDVLFVDDASLSAAGFSASSFSSTTSGTFTLTGGGKAVVLETPIATMSTTNFTFADGSFFLVGDNTSATTNDSGANTLTGSDHDDRFYGLAGNDTLNGGEGNDFFSTGFTSANFGNDSVSGGNGTDTFAYASNSANAATVNLLTHSATNSQGNTSLTSIEVVYGTAGNDSFTGGDAAHITNSVGNRTTERFRGLDGNDTITGGAGNDFFTIADYANNDSDQPISVDLSQNKAIDDGRGGEDALINVDGVRGGEGDDLLVGGSLSRSSSGGFFEQYRGNGGNDTLDGNNASSDGEDASSDRADYSNNTSAQAIVVDLSQGMASDGRGGTDTLIEINSVNGGAGNDTMTGDDFNNSFDGGQGNDVLDGGEGSDSARFDQSTAGVIVNLSTGSINVNSVIVAAGTANDGMGGTDTLISMENVRGSEFDDYIRGSDDVDVRQFFAGDAGNDTIDGGDGIDIANYGEVPILFGGINGLVANGSGTIDDRRGGTDTLINVEGLSGTNSADTLTGGAGDQWFRGNGGDDTIDGGADSDWVFYSNSPTAVVVNLATNTAQDGWDGQSGQLDLGGQDTLISIENAEGSDYADTLTGDDNANELRGRDGNDTIVGGLGNDTLRGGLGNDSLDGGTGSDTADFSNATAGATASLLAGAASDDGRGGSDVFVSIENLLGGDFNDTLIGDGAANTLDGAAGNDTLQGGGGNDALDGGDDVDTADYSTALSGVTVNLTLGTASNDGQGGADTLANIENVRGSTFADVLTGDAAANAFDGNGGVDRFIGGGGNDSYTVDAQSDLVFESLGEGTDTIISSASFYLYANVENLTLTGTALFGVGNTLANTLTGNAEQNLLIGWDGNDTIDGGAARDTIYGVEGDDTLYGQAGIDYIVGGNGNDTIYGGNDADEVYGQDGNDVIYGGDDFATDILVGGAGNDTIDGGAAWDQMYGNAGDDTFYVSQQVDWVFEQPGEGTDTVIADSPNGFYLYANIENLTLAGLTAFGVGNTLDNTLTGNAVTNVLLGGDGNDRINGKAGNDVLWGQNGVDTFVFERGTGIDNVGDFVAGADKVELSGLGYSSYGQIQSLITGTVNTVINLGQGDFAILVNVAPGTLSSTDFVFS